MNASVHLQSLIAAHDFGKIVQKGSLDQILTRQVIFCSDVRHTACPEKEEVRNDEERNRRTCSIRP